jgi:hypothetical protein
MGKRVIRLTESDLIRLVKRVISEDEGTGVTSSYATKVWDCMKRHKLITWDKSSYNKKKGEDKYMLSMNGSFTIKSNPRGKVGTYRIDITSSDGIRFHSVLSDSNNKTIRESIKDLIVEGNFCEDYIDKVLDYINKK